MPGPSDMSKATQDENPAGFPSTYWVIIPSTNRGEPTS
jgi:hypothetical protein